MTLPQNRCIVVLALPKPVPKLLEAARAIATASGSNPFLPDPAPSIAALQAAIDALDRAEVATRTRAVGTVPARNATRRALRALFQAFAAFVQLQADANPDQAAAIIANSGMRVRKASTRRKVPFGGRLGPNSGTVILEVLAAAKRASYEWQWSADGGKTWKAAAPTLQAHTEITGLPVGTYVQLRYRAITKSGARDWSPPITMLVV